LPKITQKIDKPIRYLSFLLLIAIIALAFSSNYELFMKYYHYIIALVLIHNAVALAVGYYFSKIMHVSPSDTRSITIETGIQNSGLGLLIIFTVFNGQGGMALIAAWWGIWHIISGFIVSQYFAYKSARPVLAK
jgi:BASS family bile acid:Na+ symporter